MYNEQGWMNKGVWMSMHEQGWMNEEVSIDEYV